MDAPKEDKKKDNKQPPEKAEKGPGGSNWSDDIENREYYYDDSTGYEVYDPDKEDAGEEPENTVEVKK